MTTKTTRCKTMKEWRSIEGVLLRRPRFLFVMIRRHIPVNIGSITMALDCIGEGMIPRTCLHDIRHSFTQASMMNTTYVNKIGLCGSESSPRPDFVSEPPGSAYSKLMRIRWLTDLSQSSSPSSGQRHSKSPNLVARVSKSLC